MNLFTKSMAQSSNGIKVTYKSTKHKEKNEHVLISETNPHNTSERDYDHSLYDQNS